MAASDLPGLVTPPRGEPARTGLWHERLFSMLLDAMPSSVLLIDSQWRIVSANRNFLEKARRSEKETVGERIDRVFPAAIIEQTDLTERLRIAIEEKQTTRGERMVYRASGLPTRLYYYSLLPISSEGSVKYVLLLLDDVTEQARLGQEVRRAEQHLASVVESASDIVLSTDIKGKILSWNPAAEKVSGLTAEEARGRVFVDLCAEARRGEAKRGIARAAEGGEFGPVEWDLMRKSGDRVPLSWVGSVMRDDLGRPTGIVVVGRDLTERRRFEAQLIRSQSLAALGVLAGGIAHEIRNPLAIASSAAQFLLEDPEDPAFRRECEEKIVEGIKRASVIIENLLRLARPVGGASKVPVDLVSVVRDALGLVANQAAIQKVRIVFESPGDPPCAWGIPSLLQQVAMNLLLNALQAMPKGGEMRTTVDEVGAEAWVRIADTGCGILAEETERIFDPFYTRRPVGTGTGLGLSICHSIVREHCGTIDVESAVGKGSVFTVKLPLLGHQEDGFPSSQDGAARREKKRAAHPAEA